MQEKGQIDAQKGNSMSKLYEVVVEGTIYVMADSEQEATRIAERNAGRQCDLAFSANEATRAWDDWGECEPFRNKGDDTHFGKTCAEILELQRKEEPDPRQQSLPLEGHQK